MAVCALVKVSRELLILTVFWSRRFDYAKYASFLYTCFLIHAVLYIGIKLERVSREGSQRSHRSQRNL